MVFSHYNFKFLCTTYTVKKECFKEQNLVAGVKSFKPYSNGIEKDFDSVDIYRLWKLVIGLD